jgi:hypothetical protein
MASQEEPFMRHQLIVSSVILALSSGAGMAQPLVVEETVGSTTAVEVPPEVRSYVVRERIPSVRIEEDVIVGRPLPPTVVLRTIPDYRDYSYAVVNERRVIVEPRTRRVIRVID